MSYVLAHPLLAPRPSDPPVPAPSRRIGAPIALGTIIWLTLDFAAPFADLPVTIALAFLVVASVLGLPILLRWSWRTSRALAPLAWLFLDLVETAAGRDMSFALATLSLILCMLAPALKAPSSAPQRT